MSKWRRTDTKTRELPRAPAKVQVKIQAKAKSKSKKRTPETCLCCGKEGRTRESRLQIQDCDMFKLRKGWSFESGAPKHEHTHEIEKDADEPSPEVTVEAVWCMAVRDTVEDGRCNCIEKHDVSSDDRNESKLTEIPEQREESKFRKMITHLETGQYSRKVIKGIETGQNTRKVKSTSGWVKTRKSGHEDRDG